MHALEFQAGMTQEVLIALVERIANGDEVALRDLFDRTHRKLFGAIQRLVRDPDTAEEVLADVYANVWRQATSFRPERGSVLTWLAAAARNRAIDALRRRREEFMAADDEQLTALEADAPSPLDRSSDAEGADDLRRALERLAEPQRVAIEAAFFDGLSHREVAEVLDVPLGTVKTRIRLGLVALREALGAESAA